MENSLTSLRDEDFARWGAYALEDIGVIEIDLVAGPVREFGTRVRRELCGVHADRLTDGWRTVAKRILRDSPGTNNATALMSVLCILTASRLYAEDRINAKEAQ